MDQDHKFFDSCDNSILKRFEKLSSFKQKGNPLGAGFKFELTLKSARKEEFVAKTFTEYVQAYYPNRDMMTQLDLNKKYVDYLHNQKLKGAKMPLNKKKIQKENLNNPEDKLSMDVKDYEEFKKFRQEKMNLESTHVV